MSRALTINATGTVSSGTEGSGYSETFTSSGLTVGQSVKFEAQVGTSMLTITSTDYGIADIGFIMLENNDTTDEILFTVKNSNGTPQTIIDIDIPFGGMFMAYFNDAGSADSVTTIELTGGAAGVDYTLLIAE